MKKLFPLITCLLLSVMAFAQGGVDFQHLTFDEVLAKAKAEKKLVFVDCYTSWCAPCKHMTSSIFPQEKMGDFINLKFISVEYDIRAYPTFIILNPDGTIYHKMVGGSDADLFIKKLEESLEEKK